MISWGWQPLGLHTVRCSTVLPRQLRHSTGRVCQVKILKKLFHGPNTFLEGALLRAKSRVFVGAFLRSKHRALDWAGCYSYH